MGRTTWAWPMTSTSFPDVSGSLAVLVPGVPGRLVVHGRQTDVRWGFDGLSPGRAHAASMCP